MRTRRLAAALAAAALAATSLTVLPGAPAAANGCAVAGAYDGGAGTVGDPYRIANRDQLLLLTSTPGDWGSHFLQTADIDVTGCTWNEIGNSGTRFTGSYSGAKASPATGSWAVSGFPDGADTDPYGMFGVVDGATITDLIVDGGMSNTGGGAVGGLVGKGAVTIRRVTVNGDVTGTSSVGGVYGGRGSHDVVLEDVTVTGDVTGTSDEIGGLVGSTYSDLTITDSTFTGSVVATRDSDANYAIGGIAGYASGVTVLTDVSVTGAGSIRGKGTEVGGAIGYSDGPGLPPIAVTITLTRVRIGIPIVLTASSLPSDVGCFIGDPGDDSANVSITASTAVSYSIAGVVTSCGAGDGGGEEGPSYVTSSGLPPTLPPGTGVWQGTDGSETPLEVSSPGVGQVRYSAPGLQVTLTGTRGTGTGNGLVADANGEVECELCAFLAAGGVIEAWVFSEPRLAAAWRTDEIARILGELPCRRFTIPVGTPLDGGVGLPPGAHTLQLVLPTVSGLQAVNVGVTVAGPVPGGIPAGEGGPAPTERPSPVAATLLVTAGLALLLRRTAPAGA